MNPVTAPIFYWISTWLGLEVLGRGVETAQIGGFVDQMPHFGLAFLIGNTLFALAVAGALGTLTFLFVRKARRSDLAKATASSAKAGMPASSSAVLQ